MINIIKVAVVPRLHLHPVTWGGQVEDELDKAELDKRTNKEFVMPLGQVSTDPTIKGCRRSSRVGESNRRLKGYHW